MNNLTLSLISAIPIGLGATLTTDLWALFLKRTFKIAPPNYCLVGRWLRYMPEETLNIQILHLLHRKAQNAR